MEQVLGRIIMDFSRRFGINLSAISPILTDSRLPMFICSPGQDQTTRAPSVMLTFKHAGPFSCTFNLREVQVHYQWTILKGGCSMNNSSDEWHGQFV